MSVDGPPASGSLPYAVAAPSLIGEVLDGRYKILRKLGEGGMGEVFAAEHVHIEKRFAIKLLRPEIISNPEAVTRFRQEARSSSSIGHRNIIAIEDFGQLADGRIYMCMELLNGAALNDLITQPQTIERLLNILIQTGHGLAAAHAKNIVHRDMKPENIFVTVGPNNEDIPKILDFGIAKVSGNDGQNNLTRTGTIFGTPFYMAPEQALGNPVDARTDIYAMGVIMYEVCSGSLPFQGESFMGILTQHITTEPEPVAQRAAKAGRPLPPGLAEVITCCMQKNPAQRYSTMDELVNALIPIYRSIAGAGMSTYMEAFPVNSGHHPVPTPPPLTGPVMVGARTPTVGAMPPPGMHPSGGHQGYPPAGGQHYTPTGMVQATGASSSGLYDPGASTLAPKKSKAGLFVAIFAVLAVGGGVAAFVLVNEGKKADAGAGLIGSASGADPGSAGSAGSGTDIVATGSNTVPADAAVVAVGSGSDPGSATTPIDTGSGASLDAGTGAGSSDVVDPPAPDAGVTEVPAVAMVQVMVVVSNAKAFEVWENDAKLFDGPDSLEVPKGGKRTVTLKAKGLKDKTLTIDAKKKLVQTSLPKLPKPINTNTNTTPPPPACKGTTADIRTGGACKKKFCAAHPEHEDLCNLQ